MTPLIETLELAGVIADINSKTAILNARVAGMVADNQQRAIQSMSMAYTAEDFEEAILGSGVTATEVDYALHAATQKAYAARYLKLNRGSLQPE